MSTQTSGPTPHAAPAPPAEGPEHGQGSGEATGPAAPSGSTHPPGNNGTVKIDGQPWDDHPDNEPHVGCVFQLDLYGYDEDSAAKALTADHLVELWPPTGSGDLVDGSSSIGEDPAGGGTDLDASVTIDIEDEVLSSGFDPHPIQGWHVRLTVHADGSIGADVKHKTFWVTCGDQQPAQPPSSTTPPIGGPSVGPTHITPTPTETESAPTSSPESPTVAPTTVRPPSGPQSLPFTGSSLGTLMAIAVLLVVAGTAALRLSARTERIVGHRRD